MQNNTENQHFVPVCYLRNFCPDSEQKKKSPRVWVYDKFSKSSKFRGAKSICYSNKLYSINSTSETLITNNISDKETIFESHYLHDFEQEYSPKLRDAIASLKERKFGGQQKMDISLFIAIQYLRDPIIKFLSADNEDIPFLTLPEEYKKLVGNSPQLLEDPSMRHFMYWYGNKNVIVPLVRSLALSEWTIHYNHDDVFFTSDNPVCLGQDKHYNNDVKEKVNAPSLNILFPLSKNVLIQIRQVIQKDSFFYKDDTPQSQIDSFNFVQAFYAKKYVIGTTNSFAEIIRRLENFPVTWDNYKLNIYGEIKNANH